MSGSFSEILEEMMACLHVDALQSHSRKLSGEGGALFVALALLIVIALPWERYSLSWWFHALVIIPTWIACVCVVILRVRLLPDLVNRAVERHDFTRNHRDLYPCEDAHRWGPPEAGALEGGQHD